MPSNPLVESPLSKGKTLLVIFLLALCIRLIFVSTLQDGFYFADSWRFDYGANHLVEKGAFPKDFERAPMYSAFLASVYSVLGDHLIVTRVLQSILGALISVCLSVIGFRTGNYWVGAFAGALWSIYPMGVFVAGMLYPSTILTMFLLLGVLSLLKANSNSGGLPWYVLGGCFFGLAALTKPIVLGVVVTVSIWIWFYARQKALASASVFALATLLAVTPWSVRQYLVHDKFVFIEARGLNELAPWALDKEARREKLRSEQWGRAILEAYTKNNASNEDIEAIRKKILEMSVDSPVAVPPPVKTSPSARARFRPAKDLTPETVVEMAREMAARYPYEFISFFELYPRRVGFLDQEKRDKVKARRNPRLVEKIPFGNSLVNAVSAFAVGFLYVFALLGIRAMWLSPMARPYLTLYLTLVFSFAAGYATSWGKIRYRVPVDPYIILLSAWGLFWSWDALLARRKPASAVKRQQEDAASLGKTPPATSMEKQAAVS